MKAFLELDEEERAESDDDGDANDDANIPIAGATPATRTGIGIGTTTRTRQENPLPSPPHVLFRKRGSRGPAICAGCAGARTKKKNRGGGVKDNEKESENVSRH